MTKEERFEHYVNYLSVHPIVQRELPEVKNYMIGKAIIKLCNENIILGFSKPTNRKPYLWYWRGIKKQAVAWIN